MGPDFDHSIAVEEEKDPDDQNHSVRHVVSMDLLM
jgi:hypothetical protein